ncbi:MAG: pilus assembly protein PilM, partial [Microcystaceae cyanobacterium]
EDLEVVQLLLAGPGGGLIQLDEYLTQRLSIPSMQIDPLTALNIETSQQFAPVERPSLGTVLGLGLRKV